MKQIVTYEVDTGVVKSLVSGKTNMAKTIEALPKGVSYLETDIKSLYGYSVVDGKLTYSEPQEPVDRKKLRRAAFQIEADPLFFKWQRGEATQEEYLQKVGEIRQRYPDQ